MKIKRIIAGLMSVIMVMSVLAGVPVTDVQAGVNAGQLKTNQNYMIVSKSSGKAMTISGYSDANNATLVQRDANGYASQVWKLEDAGNGYYRIVNNYSGKVLDVPNSSTEQGKQIIQFDKGDGDNQKWKISDAGNGLCRISPKIKESFGLNVSGNSTSNGAGIVTWNYGNGADNMKWEFKEVSSVKENPKPEKAEAKKALDAYIAMFLKDEGDTSRLNNISGHWAEAEAIEIILDGYDRFGDEKYLNIAKELVDGFVKRKGENWEKNEYNDDIMWSCIMCARLYLMCKDQKYLTYAKENFDLVYERAYDNVYDGGIYWKENHKEKSKNACVNGPGAIAACYIAQGTGDDGYYEKAKALVEWEKKTLVQDNGRVYDNIGTYNGKAGEKKNWAFTYNQGTFIGACTLVYEKYKDQKYLDWAYKASEFCAKNEGTIRIAGEDDGADAIGFKGILARWMGKYALDNNVKDFNEYLQKWADTAWTNRNSDNLMWTNFEDTTMEDIQNCKDEIDGGANEMDDRKIGNYASWGCGSAVSWLVSCADIADRQAELHNENKEDDNKDNQNNNNDNKNEDNKDNEETEKNNTADVGPQPGNGDAVDIGNSSNSWDVKSPDGDTVISIKLDSGKLKYSVKQDGTTIVEESEMGINTSKGDFTSGLAFKSASAKKINETYKNLSGIKEISTNHCHEATITFTKSNTEFQLIARAYDDGVAFRYKVNSSGTIKIEPNNEKTSFKLPGSATVWYTNYHNQKGNFMYEKDYEKKSMDEVDRNKNSIIIAQPMTYQVGSKYAMFTEAQKSGTYVGSFLQPEGNGVLRTIFDQKQERAVETTAPFQTPWRALVIGDANTIVTNSMAENLSPAPDEQYKFEEWVNPGVSSWSWVGNWGNGISDQSKKETHMNWIDLAAQMGWRYYILDERWQPEYNKDGQKYKGMRDWFPEVREYAKEKGVELIAWVHQNDMNTAAEREERFKEWSEAGIKGIKIDFFYYEDQSMLQLHEDIYETAAKYKMLVNVHGSNPPSGERRTYPNVLAREAIKGQEQGGITAYQYCILPFTRTAVGTADVTEELYSKDANKTSMGYQIALSVLIENGIRSLGGKPSDYLGIPSAVSYYKNFPEKWDETKLLDSKIAEYVNIARRSGDGWYAAGISVNERDLALKTDFLEEGTTYTAILYHEKDEKERKDLRTEIKKNITKDSTLNFHIQQGGGYAVKIYPQTGGSLRSVKAFPSAVKLAINSTKDVKVMLTPSKSPMHDFDWKATDSSIASIEKTAVGATIKGLKEGKTQIVGTSAFDETKKVTIDVEVTADPYPMNTSKWKVINDNGKYKITGENSVRITAESGVIQNNVFTTSIPNNASNFTIEAKISGGLADNYQGGFIGVFKEELGNEFVGVGRRYHTNFKKNNSANLMAMMSGNDEQYVADPKQDGDVYVKLEKNGSKYTGSFRTGTSGNWTKIAEMTKNNLSNSSDLRIGVYTGCGGGSSAVDITFTDFKYNNETIKFANRNNNAPDGEVFTVEFDAAGGEGEGLDYQFLTQGQKVSKPADPKKGDFKFLGWYADGKEYNFNDGVNKDLLLTAKWEGEYGNLVLEAEAGTLSGSAKVTESADASNGFLVGEVGGAEKGAITFTVSADIADVRTMKLYFAQEDTREFQVTVNDSQKVNVVCPRTESWTKPAETAETLEVELQKGENKIVISGVGNDDAPNLDKIEIGVTPAEAKAVVEKLIAALPEAVTEADKAVVLAVKAAYDSAEKIGATGVTGVDKLNTAVAMVKGEHISAELQAAQAEYQKQLGILGAMDEAGFSEAGWKATQEALNAAKAEYDKGAKADAATLRDLVAKLTAAIDAMEESAVTYTVTFDSKDGSDVPAQTIVSGEKAQEPDAPTKKGYTFAGWRLAGVAYDFNTPVTKNITLTARWEVDDELLAAQGDFEKFEKDMDAKAENKDLYSEDSWKLLEEAYEAAREEYEKDEDADIKKLRELVDAFGEALEDLVELYTVTFECQGAVISTQLIEAGDTVERPTNPLPPTTGWSFRGWCLEGTNTLYDFNTPVESDITLVAVWNVPNNGPVQQAPVDNSVKVQQILIKGGSTKVAAGKRIALTAEIAPATATNQTVKWNSSNPAYATVDANGVVTTTKAGKNRTVTITAIATDGSQVTSNTYVISIMEKAVKKVKITGSKTVKAGKSIRLRASVTPKASSKKINSKIVWSSNAPKYATVSSSGVVKTKKAGKGKTVRITASATDGSGKKATVKIKIK